MRGHIFRFFPIIHLSAASFLPPISTKKPCMCYVTVTLLYGDQQLDLAHVLSDTGSAGTLFAADQVLAIGLQYEADDPVQCIRRIGGASPVPPGQRHRDDDHEESDNGQGPRHRSAVRV